MGKLFKSYYLEKTLRENWSPVRTDIELRLDKSDHDVRHYAWALVGDWLYEHLNSGRTVKSYAARFEPKSSYRSNRDLEQIFGCYARIQFEDSTSELEVSVYKPTQRALDDVLFSLSDNRIKVSPLYRDELIDYLWRYRDIRRLVTQMAEIVRGDFPGAGVELYLHVDFESDDYYPVIRVTAAHEGVNVDPGMAEKFETWLSEALKKADGWLQLEFEDGKV